MKKFRAAIIAACLALSIVLVAAPRASAHPSQPERPLGCTGDHMVQKAGVSGITENIDGATGMDVWVAESYLGSQPCYAFQAVVRIYSAIPLNSGEPIIAYNVTLRQAGTGYDLGGYNWLGHGWTPAWGQGFWYFYGPVVQLGCTTGQVYAHGDASESYGEFESISDSSDGGYTTANGANQNVC